MALPLQELGLALSHVGPRLPRHFNRLTALQDGLLCHKSVVEQTLQTLLDHSPLPVHVAQVFVEVLRHLQQLVLKRECLIVVHHAFQFTQKLVPGIQHQTLRFVNLFVFLP